MGSQERVSGEPFCYDETHFDKFLNTMGIRWREVSPELCAARHSHRIYCFSLEHIRFRDPEFAKWAQRFQEILFDPAEIKRLRCEHLTVEEQRQVRREIVECKREMADLEQDKSEGVPPDRNPQPNGNER